MSEVPSGESVVRTLESFSGPIEAFKIVAEELLTEAALRGVVDFEVNDIQMIDAVGAINTVGKHLDENPDERWEQMFSVIRWAYDLEEVRNHGVFGIEAQLKDNKVTVWYVN